MDVDTFCERLAKLEGLSAKELAEAILWYLDRLEPGSERTPGELSRLIEKHGLGKPHSTALGRNLAKSPRAMKGKVGYKIKAASRKTVQDELAQILADIPPEIDVRAGYLPEAVWKGTRGYIETVCYELNGCVQMHFFNAAAVLIRRLIETLIIEAYVSASRENEIQDASGNYFMLAGLVGSAKQNPGLQLGRDAKRAMDSVKELGDRAAHNPRFRATAGDLEKVESGVRVLADELIALAGLRRT